MKSESRLGKNIVELVGVVGIPGLYLFNLYLIAYQNTNEQSMSLMLSGLIIASLGIGIWIYSYISLGRSFGVLPKRQQRVSSGIYRLLKHPMYLGIMMTFVGLATSLGSRTGLIFSILILLPILVIRAKWEEKELARYARTTRS